MPLIDDLGADPTALRRLRMTEKSRTFEIGAEYSNIDVFTPGDTLTLRANAYATDLWDITTYTVAGSMGTDLERVETEGVELEASYGLANGVYIDVAGHVGSGQEINPAGAAVASAQWRNTPADRLQLTMGKKWNDTWDLSWEVVHAADRRDSTGADLADVTLHNLRATYRPDQGWARGAEFRVGLENLFDEDYVSHLSSAGRKAPGRNLKVTLSKTF
jgi:hemoglobin/transferrin/lactoferrin receptor protein